MPNFKKSFPGKYLQITDLDLPLVATIDRVPTETVGAGLDAEEKPVAHFKEAGVKALVLNMTRCEAIATIADSADTDAWAGVRVQLSRGATRFQGKTVACIVVSKPSGGVPLSPASALDEQGF